MSQLTKPQLALLTDINRRPEIVHGSYRPAMKLVALGFADAAETAYGAVNLMITEAGRVFLKGHPS